MQVMPATYADLQSRYDLGFDPWEPHDNIMAGTAYIREMYDRFGSPGFLAAYNAGPGRVNSYLSGGQPLPAETVSYVASITPRLGEDTGPAYPSAPPVAVAAREPTPQGCDLDAAYDPLRPCAPAPVVMAAAEPPPPQYPAPSVLYHPAPPPVQYASLPVQASASPGVWAVQVGAFSSPSAARLAATNARNALPGLLGAAQVAISTTEPFGSTVLFRARLTNLSATTAAAACTDLAEAQMPCLLVRPSGG